MPDTLSLTVEDVSEKNANGWYTVEFEDADPASTKSEALAKEAFQKRGSVADVIISEVKSGKFTNRYLNSINGVKDVPKRSSGGTTATPKDNERIARQWAYGRATELMIAAGGPSSFPLSEKDIEDLKSTADSLLTATR